LTRRANGSAFCQNRGDDRADCADFAREAEESFRTNETPVCDYPAVQVMFLPNAESIDAPPAGASCEGDICSATKKTAIAIGFVLLALVVRILLAAVDGSQHRSLATAMKRDARHRLSVFPKFTPPLFGSAK